MRKAFKYRLYPNKKQEQSLTTMVETHRHLYNRACEQIPEVKKTLSDRVHLCPFCGYTADRDVNAAQNILRLGRSHQALSTPMGVFA